MGIRTDYDGALIRAGRIDLKRLAQLSTRPNLFDGRERNFWTDPYVSQHVLDAHLDPHIDDASRRPSEIAQTVEHIVRVAGDAGLLERESPELLDLACGPGLYAEQFAVRGFDVVGMDISELSIEHARSQARAQGLSIDYRLESFLDTPLGGPYEVITLIYGEFCTFDESQQRALLRAIKVALAPGGLFAFDVFTERYVNRMRGACDWYVSGRSGFWQHSPHLVLERVYRYDEEYASVARYLVIDSSGKYRMFSVWWRHYTSRRIKDLLEDEGFVIAGEYATLWGTEQSDADEWIGLFATAR